MYTTLDPKNKLSMIFIGLLLTTMLFITIHFIIIAKATVTNVIEKVEDSQCRCEDDP